jgi:hypothetical protein
LEGYKRAVNAGQSFNALERIMHVQLVCESSFTEFVEKTENKQGFSVSQEKPVTKVGQFLVLSTSVALTDRIDEALNVLYNTHLATGSYQMLVVNLETEQTIPTHAYVITSENVVIPLRGDYIEQALEVVTNYCSVTDYKLELSYQDTLDEDVDFARLCEVVRLFTLFSSSAFGDIGAVAKRREDGFLITSNSIGANTINYTKQLMFQESDLFDG